MVSAFVVVCKNSWPNPEFLIFGTSAIWGQVILCCGGCPMNYRMFNHISGFYPLDASIMHPASKL